MWKGVLKMAGTTYQEGQPLNISNERQEEMLHTMRNYYSMFGLGTKTLLDVPNEAVGFKGFLSQVGNYWITASVSLITIHRFNWHNMYP